MRACSAALLATAMLVGCSSAPAMLKPYGVRTDIVYGICVNDVCRDIVRQVCLTSVDGIECDQAFLNEESDDIAE